jgi:hypothetical protein
MERPNSCRAEYFVVEVSAMRDYASVKRRAGVVLAMLLITTLACAGPAIVPVTLTPTPGFPDAAIQPATATLSSTPTITPTVESITLPPPLPTAAPLPTATPAVPWLPGEVHVYPGPLHYEGDILSVEVVVNNIGDLPSDRPATLSVDGEEPLSVLPIAVRNPLRDNLLRFRWAWDTAGQQGRHELSITVPVNDKGDVEVLLTYVEILSAERRPEPELHAVWQQMDIFCCQLAYLSGTAAERDIQQIAAQAQESVAAVEQQLGFSIPDKPIPIVLSDNVWGDATCTVPGLVIGYVDRDYVGTDLDLAIRHEAAHRAARTVSTKVPAMLSEGFAVYVAGGYYEPGSIPERAAAMLELGSYIPLAELATGFRSHRPEIAYPEAGALVAYLVETYSWQQFLVLYSVERDVSGAEWLDQTFRLLYNRSLEDVEASFVRWLERQAPGEQTIEDVRLTIALRETTRRYQDLYAPYQECPPPLAEAVALNITADYMREPTTAENIAIETMLVAAHQALHEGRYADADVLLGAVNIVLDDGDFTREPVGDYVAIARLLLASDHEPQRITITGDRATVQTIRVWPQLTTLEVAKIMGEWMFAD